MQMQPNKDTVIDIDGRPWFYNHTEWRNWEGKCKICGLELSTMFIIPNDRPLIVVYKEARHWHCAKREGLIW